MSIQAKSIGREESTRIGQSLARLEDEQLLRGRGNFIDDIEPGDRTLHVAFVRSPYAHARILGVDISEAQALEGVVAVLTGADFVESIKPFSADFDYPGFKVTYRRAMPVDRVRFVGDTLAMVLAHNPYVALDAAELVAPDLEALSPVSNAEAALAEDAPLVHDNIADNVVFEGKFESEGFDVAHGDAPLKLSETFTAARQRGRRQWNVRESRHGDRRSGSAKGQPAVARETSRTRSAKSCLHRRLDRVRRSRIPRRRLRIASDIAL